MNMVAEIARDPETRGLPISAIGGITTWRDAAEFMALGAGNVQVCTAAMTYGFKIVGEMVEGLSNWMAAKGHASLDDIVGRAVPNVTRHVRDLKGDRGEAGRISARAWPLVRLGGLVHLAGNEILLMLDRGAQRAHRLERVDLERTPIRLHLIGCNVTRRQHRDHRATHDDGDRRQRPPQHSAATPGPIGTDQSDSHL